MADCYLISGRYVGKPPKILPTPKTSSSLVDNNNEMTAELFEQYIYTEDEALRVYDTAGAAGLIASFTPDQLRVMLSPDQLRVIFSEEELWLQGMDDVLKGDESVLSQASLAEETGGEAEELDSMSPRAVHEIDNLSTAEAEPDEMEDETQQEKTCESNSTSIQPRKEICESN